MQDRFALMTPNRYGRQQDVMRAEHMSLMMRFAIS
jgi:hypothetical protein